VYDDNNTSKENEPVTLVQSDRDFFDQNTWNIWVFTGL